jgi:hypothetical protein
MPWDLRRLGKAPDFEWIDADGRLIFQRRAGMPYAEWIADGHIVGMRWRLSNGTEGQEIGSRVGCSYSSRDRVTRHHVWQ